MNHDVPERIHPDEPSWELFYHEHAIRYQFFADRCRGKRVLDAACGVGYGSRILKEMGAESVLGVDVASDAVQVALEKYGGDGIDFRVGDVQNMDPQIGSFDVAISFETIEHVGSPSSMIRSVAGLLPAGGTFICSTPNPSFSGGLEAPANPYHVSELTLPEFQTVFEEYFSVDAIWVQAHTPELRRYVEFVQELHRISETMRYSLFLRLENRIRKLFAKTQLPNGMMQKNLLRFIPGDFVIVPIGQESSAPLVYILEGHRRHDIS